jgi:hypothetical protein
LVIATDLEQLEPEGLDLGDHPVQFGLIRYCSGQHGVLTSRLSPQGGERRAHRLTQVPSHPDLVPPLLRPAMCAGRVVSGHEIEPGRRQDERPTYDSDDF